MGILCISVACLWWLSIVSEILNWDNNKVTGLFRKACAGNALAAGASPDETNRHLGWEGDPQSLSYTGASLEAEMDMLAGFSKQGCRENHHLSDTPPHGGERWRTQLVNACVLSVYSLFCTGAHMPETPLYRSVCLVRCNIDW